MVKSDNLLLASSVVSVVFKLRSSKNNGQSTVQYMNHFMYIVTQLIIKEFISGKIQ